MVNQEQEMSAELKHHLVVFCTCPSYEIACDIAKKVVDTQLAACANIIPGLTSIYTWEGKTETSSEVLLLLKTTESVYPRLEQSLIQLHPYDCPEVIGVPIQQGNKGYLEWLTNSVT